MPSDFLVDLIDHKRRVGLYMQKFANKLFQRTIKALHEGVDPVKASEASLIDIARMFCHQIEELDLDEQVLNVTDNTINYICGKRLDSNLAMLQFIVCELFQRAVVHDNSKFSPEEYEPYEAAFPELQKYAYGTEEFKAALRKIKPAIQHHYENNRHHPEWHANGINGMNLLDIIEMTCDWIAASERSQKDIFEGLEMNKERFKISDQLHVVIKNTVIELTWGSATPT